MTTPQSVINAILGVTTNTEVREAMLLGADLESSLNPDAVGDNNTSFGAFQMHIGGDLTSSGGTQANADNPTWAASKMLAAYEAAVNSIPQSLWQSNPEEAAEEAAVAAEDPAESYYASQGTNAVNDAWATVQSVLGGSTGGTSGAPSTSASSTASGDSGASGTGSTTSATTTSASLPFPGGSWDPLNWPYKLGESVENDLFNSIKDALEDVEKDIWAKLKPLLIRFGLIVLGAFIVYAGIQALTRQSAGPTQIIVGGAKKAASTNE